jgi:hypothetical protein
MVEGAYGRFWRGLRGLGARVGGRVVEFVAQSCVSIYYNLWNIRNVTSHYSSECSSYLGTIEIAKLQLGYKCSLSYSTLKGSLGVANSDNY